VGFSARLLSNVPLRKLRKDLLAKLSGITSPWPEARASVAAERQREALRLWSTLGQMLALHYGRPMPQSPNVRLTTMLMLLGGTDTSIYELQTTRFQCVEHEAALLIAERITIVVRRASTTPAAKPPWEDVYWLGSELQERIRVDVNVMVALVDETMIGLKGLQERLKAAHEEQVTPNTAPSATRDDQSIATCFDRVTNRHIELWFRSAGASWLSEEPLFMLWDKLCAHEAVIPLLKNALYQLFGTIAGGSPEMYKRTEPDQLLSRTLSLSVQLQVIKVAIDDVLNRALVSTEIPISLTY